VDDSMTELASELTAASSKKKITVVKNVKKVQPSL
jgi:hypothetical protein